LTQSSNIDSYDNRNAHVQAIETILENKFDRVKNGICPKCGCVMVQRMAMQFVADYPA
jgi:hypothetical protein